MRQFSGDLWCDDVITSAQRVRLTSEAPMVAIIEILPCFSSSFSSTERRRLDGDTSPSAATPRATGHDNGSNYSLPAGSQSGGGGGGVSGAWAQENADHV